MSDQLPSIDNLPESELPSVDEFIIEEQELPSIDEFVEKEEEVIEERVVVKENIFVMMNRNVNQFLKDIKF